MSQTSTDQSKLPQHASSTYINRPRYGTLKTAQAYSGRSRSRLYQLAAQHRGLFVKDGRTTLVDFEKFDAILSGLPPAEIKLPHLAKARRG